jgi:hypothetical protein
MLMRATFPKTDDLERLVHLEWPDGFRATMRVGQRFDRLPHDLEHYVIDAELRRPWAFWPMLAQKAPYKSVTPEGGWPAERVRWFDDVKKRRKADLDESEVLAGPFISIARGELLLDDWKQVRTSLARVYTTRARSPVADLTRDDVERVVEAYTRMERRWQQVKFGDSLAVPWPAKPPSRGKYAVRPQRRKVGKLRIR